MWQALRVVVPVVVLALCLTGCFADSGPGTPAPDRSVPDVGACRVLTPADAARSSNSTDPVPCDRPHTAQTFVVTSSPDRFADASYDDRALASYAYRDCSRHFMRFTGADESLAMRTILSWVWFRPTEAAWRAGARWYRCDVIGGGDQTARYVDLPTRTKGLLLGRPKDQWLVCAQGATVSGSVKVPCSHEHDWRAVTTIVLGDADDPYPGDRTVQQRTRDFCSRSVGAWLGYPVDYDFGYSWFHTAEWSAGNRRSVCWAKTDS
jgi:hypothetical protein